MKTKGKAAARGKPQPVSVEAKASRYLRAARVIVAEGDGIDLAELAAKAGLSPASAAYCLDAFRGVCQALREAKQQPAIAAPRKPPAIAAAPDEAPAAAHTGAEAPAAA